MMPLLATQDQARQGLCRITVLGAMGMPRRQIAQQAGVAPSTITRDSGVSNPRGPQMRLLITKIRHF
jgi:hypothetical protein